MNKISVVIQMIQIN